MKMLKMNGYPITNIRDYNRHFNVYDILKQHKEFLLFISSHFANLSRVFSYCTAMAHTAIESCVPLCMRNDIYNKQADIDFDRCHAKNFWDNPFAFCQTCSPSPELRRLADVIAKQFAPKASDAVFQRAMLITIAAFALLDDQQTEPRIDLEKAKKSFLGKEDNKQHRLHEIRFDDDGSDCIQTIKLEPASHVYTCEPFDDTDFAKIKTFRVEASRKIHSLSNRTVKIDVGGQQIVIPTGEHVYVNTVNGQVAAILGKSRSKKAHTLQNIGMEKDVLKFDDENAPVLDFYGNEYISSFDFSANDHTIVYLNNLRLCLHACASPVLLERLTAYSDLNLVEVRLVNGKFYLLKNNGELLSNDATCNGEQNVYSIESALRRLQA